MKAACDSELLRLYAERKQEAAFATLVRRHADLVYATAVRFVADRHLAQDVTQSVFVALAHNARRLATRTNLASWLYVTSRNLAAKSVRTEVRRRAREKAAVSSEPNASGSDRSWEQIDPHFDAALADLNEGDREALLLRFFENKTAREIGERLGSSEEAAQKKVTRALDRLRQSIARRGVALPAAVLGGAISSHAATAAPAGFSQTLASQALAKAAATPALTIFIQTAKLMGPIKFNSLATAAAVVACLSLGGAGFIAGRKGAEKHRKAVKWQSAIQEAPREIPASANPTFATGALASAPGVDTASRQSVTDIMSTAAMHFRATGTLPDAWAKGYVALQELRPEDLEAALRELASYRGEQHVFETLAPPLMGLWARRDGPAALGFAMANVGERSLAVTLEHVARGWATHDPAAALAWFQETAASGQRPIPDGSWQWIPKPIFSEWAARDPKAAFDGLSRLDFAQQDAARFGIAAAATEPETRPGILSALETLPDENLKRRVAETVAAQWARVEPQAAARWAERLAFDNPGDRMSVLAEIAEEWWPVDPDATGRWVLANAPAEFRDLVVSAIANRARR